MHFTNWYGMDTENDPTGLVTLVACASEEGRLWVWKKAGEFRKWCDESTDDSPVVLCHNLEYDLRNEFGDYFPYLQLTYLKGRLISSKYRHVTFYDSFNHFRMPLKKIGSAFGLEKKEYDIHSEEYVATDAMIPVKAMAFTRDYIKTLGGEMGATAGSSALSVWLAMTGGEFLTGPFDDPWLRRGYAGGRTEIFRDHAHGRIRGYDVNSMFPSCMLDDFPMMVAEDPSMSKKKGMAEVTISVPDTLFVAPLVWRNKDGRLTYPVGVFRGIWTYDEIRYAETLGSKVIKVHKALGGNYCERPFDEFVGTIYGKRVNSDNPAEREVLKVILNSLYGKLASHNTITRVVCKHTMLKSGSKRLKDVLWIDHNRGLLDYHTPQQRYVNVLWGAMVTANARIALSKLLSGVPPEKLIYSDTDSIYCVDHEMPLSTGLGGLKLELDKKDETMEVRQLKAYRIGDDYKAKGIPKPKRDEVTGAIVIDFAKDYIEKGLAEFEAPVRFRESLRLDKARGLKPNQWIKRHKNCKSSYSVKKLSQHRYFPPVVGLQLELFPAA